MNEFDNINHKIQDILGDRSRIFIFHNGYRFDPKLEPILAIERPSGRTITRCKLLINKDLPSLSFTHIVQHINHSYEPLYYNMDKDYFNTLVDHTNSFIKYIIHSEKNSMDLRKIQEHGLESIHWFANGYLCAEHWYRLYKDLRILKTQHPIKHKFICANRLMDNDRVYRIKFLNMLDTSQGLYSLLENDPQTNRTPNEIYPNNQVSASSFDSHENSSAWLDLESYYSEEYQDFYPSAWKSSFLHVVTETVIDRQHLTEKIFKPIAMGNPFVLVGGQGSLQYLRDYGFKTFGQWWDEGYDSIEDPAERMQAVADVVNGIGNMTLLELEKLRTSMQSVLDYNYNWFYNGFADKCWRELAEQLDKTETQT